MSDTSHMAATGPETVPPKAVDASRPESAAESTAESAGNSAEESAGTSGWLSVVVFGGVMLVIGGAFHAVMGLVALFDPGYYLVTRRGLVVTVDFTWWGWVHLAVGALAVAAGVGVLGGRAWARVLGIVLASLSALVNVAFVAAYPLWTMILVALDLLVVYALAAYGRELRDN